ncbi:MAG: tRNA lysidine(34) synthetase TilS [Actinobacteria bacterium]|nr:tRNA lysidine(34) synthetase TilS [Actinomycetota bacterium]
MAVSDIEKKILLNVRKAISDYSMIESNQRVLVSVSGGPDSVALLLILNHLSSELSLQLGVFHLNHGLRKEAASDEKFVKELAENLKLPFYGFKADVREIASTYGISLEEAGRKARYELLEKVSLEEGYERVALGHTMSDVAETVIMKLLTHSSAESLRGIPPKRGKYIRPLIYLKRRDVLEFLSFLNQPYCVDTTNLGKENLRARIRNEILPLFLKINPSFEEKMFSLSNSAFEIHDYLEEEAKKVEKECFLKVNNEPAIDTSKANNLHPAVLKRFIFNFLLIAGVNEKRISSEMVDEAVQVFLGQKKSLDLPGRSRLVRRKHLLLASPKKKELLELKPIKIELPGKAILKEAGFLLEVSLLEERPSDLLDGKYSCILDADKVGKKIVVRSFKEGDRMKPLGMSSEKKLQDIFVDEKVEREKRKLIPVLTNEDGRIFWLATLRISEDFKVDEHTKRYYWFRIKLLEE